MTGVPAQYSVWGLLDVHDTMGACNPQLHEQAQKTPTNWSGFLSLARMVV